MKKAIIFGMLLALVISGCKKNEDNGTETDPQIIGIVGEWYSSGDNVALLLAPYYDSIYAKFNDDNTYLVEAFTPADAKTTFIGTYTQEKSGYGTIWNITLNQSSPTVLTSVGIFDISTAVNPFTMQYEVLQTEPSLGFTPPSASANPAFGSTNGGSFGTMNVQKYIKIVP